MRNFAALFTDSYREFKHLRTVTTTAMFGAISIILGYFTIIVGDYLKIGFSSVANGFVYYMFGPVVGGCYGGAIDVLKYLLRPTAAFVPGLTFNAILAGVLYGVILYKRPLSLGRVLVAKFLVMLVCNVLLNTLWLSMAYGHGMAALLPIRALKNLVLWPVDSFLFYSIGKMLEAAGVFKMVKKVGHHTFQLPR